jgi:predicted nucleotidyltransferase
MLNKFVVSLYIIIMAEELPAELTLSNNEATTVSEVVMFTHIWINTLQN